VHHIHSGGGAGSAGTPISTASTPASLIVAIRLSSIPMPVRITASARALAALARELPEE
jgi:hypothetical protein